MLSELWRAFTRRPAVARRTTPRCQCRSGEVFRPPLSSSNVHPRGPKRLAFFGKVLGEAKRPTSSASVWLRPGAGMRPVDLEARARPHPVRRGCADPGHDAVEFQHPQPGQADAEAAPTRG